MEREPTRKPKLREMLEACRFDQDDLAQPEMRELAETLAASPQWRGLFERLQLFDAAASAAFRDVPVPDGLQERILARLAVEDGPRDVANSEPVVARNGQGAGETPSGTLRTSRRRWLLAASGLAAAAAGLLWGVFGLFSPVESISRAELIAAAIERFVNEPAERGQVLAASPSRFPLSEALVALTSGQIAVIRWRPVNDFFGAEVDAFDLIGSQGRVATVYAGRFAVEGLPAEVPPRPMLSTAETSASAWREHDVVYVLVVEGGDRAYERLVGVGAGPLA